MDKPVKEWIQETASSLENIAREHREHETHIGLEEQKAAQELENRVKQLSSAVAEIVNLKDQGMEIDELKERMQKSFALVFPPLVKQLEERKEAHTEELAAAEEAVRQAESSGRQALLLTAGLITLLGVTAAFFMRRSIVKPLHALHKGTEIIGQGNLDYKVGTRAKDEIGQLSRAFDRMTEDLKKTTTSIDSLNKEIAERQRAEKELRIKDSAITSSINAIALADLEGNLTYVNPSFLRMWGYDDEKEILGRNASEFWQVAQEAVEVMQAAMATGAWVGELVAKRKDGSLFDVHLSATVISDEAGKPIYRMGSFIDITQRKQAEKELADRATELKKANIRLKEVDRLKSVFLASMSHELRTPLNSIIGFTSLMLEGMVGEINEEQEEQLGLVKSSADHLLNLINDILDMSKIEAGKAEVSTEEFKLGDVMREVVGTLSPIASLKGIEVVGDVPENLALFTDRRRLKQVLMNLAGNAVKFTDQGSVKIAGRVLKDDSLEISVIDTGMGIKEEDMDKLFVPFQQIEESLAKKHEGTGLGLHLSKKLVNLLGGDIWAKSEYGKGSEFTFTIPLQYKRGEK